MAGGCYAIAAPGTDTPRPQAVPPRPLMWNTSPPTPIPAPVSKQHLRRCHIPLTHLLRHRRPARQQLDSPPWPVLSVLISRTITGPINACSTPGSTRPSSATASPGSPAAANSRVTSVRPAFVSRHPPPALPLPQKKIPVMSSHSLRHKRRQQLLHRCIHQRIGENTKFAFIRTTFFLSRSAPLACAFFTSCAQRNFDRFWKRIVSSRYTQSLFR